MPLNVRRFCTFAFLVLTLSIVAAAQTSADVMRERVAKAKAFIAVKNYNAAIYELENIRRETKEPAVNNVINILLMNSYLEQSDYKRAQDFLKELSDTKKQPNSMNYFAVAGQVVKGARGQLERYKALGLSVSDRNLPLEAITDIEKMRETLEMVVEQSKVLGRERTKTSDAMALIEEATNARGGLARDDFDASRWKTEVADAREQLANSRSVVTNAVDGTTTSAAATVAIAQIPLQTANLNSTAVLKPGETTPNINNVSAPAENPKPLTIVRNNPPAETPAKVENPAATAAPKEIVKQPVEPTKTETTVSPAPIKDSGANQKSVETGNSDSAKIDTSAAANNSVSAKTNEPIAVGSLIDYVTQKVNPIYPPAAKTIRMSGVVTVDVLVDEQGKVSQVQKTSGPAMLQRAAADAIKKWKFKPFVRDGQPTKASGYVSFNFNL